MRCVQRSVCCAENIQLGRHAEQKHCNVLEIVTPFMDAVEERAQGLVHIDGAVLTGIVLEGEDEQALRVWGCSHGTTVANEYS